jgi:hypothetical protein
LPKRCDTRATFIVPGSEHGGQSAPRQAKQTGGGDDHACHSTRIAKFED